MTLKSALTVQLTGSHLTPQQLESIASGAQVTLSDEGLQVMACARDTIEKAAAKQQAIYGVTTGLGPKVVETLPQSAQHSFSLSTIRGRHHAVGNPLQATWVRAGMAARANTLLCGASGARPELAQHIARCLNKQVTPFIPQSGNIGVADLTWGGAFGSTMIGEGKVINADGTTGDAQAALQAANITKYAPALREGLALVSHSCFSGGISALASRALLQSYQSAQIAASLSMEGFRANTSPLDARVLAIHPQAGQHQAAQQLRQLLKGSTLLNKGSARRLQDPLSIRNIVQVHGSVQATLDILNQAVTDEINGASDNPAVLHQDNQILSHGGYLPVFLCITLTSTLQSFVHLAALQVARISKLLFKRFSDLENGLTTTGTEGAGLAPLMKTAESLYAEISHLASPAPIYPGLSADGLEDVVTHCAIPAKAAFAIAERQNQLTACEMLVALQSIDVRGIKHSISPALQKHYDLLRSAAPLVTQDRPLGGDIEAIATLITHKKLSL